VNVQLFFLDPPLEQAPDQIASPPVATVRVMLLPTANALVVLLLVLTLIPLATR
jgi:hypothetical protein